MTIKQMLDMDMHHQRWYAENNPLVIYQRSKIKEFCAAYNGRINTATQRLLDVDKEYYVFEGEERKVIEKDEKRVNIMVEGKTFADYKAAVATILEETVPDI